MWCEQKTALMGGTSGALYDIFFSAAAAAVTTEAKATADVSSWSLALEAGVAAMMKYGGAKRGDRTMLDALLPASEALRLAILNDGGDIGRVCEAVETAATAGAAETCVMTAGAGRSSYVPVDVLKTVPDPGATAAATWMRAVAASLRS